MGIKYQIRNADGKVVIRTKEAWDKYRKKEGYSLEIWLGKGNGWAFISGSTRPKPRRTSPVVEKQDNISDCVRGTCKWCGVVGILGEGLCRKCWDSGICSKKGVLV